MKPKPLGRIGLVACAVLVALACATLAAAAETNGPTAVASESPGRPRIIATTDGEIDDRCSMVRFLLYANEWDIEGIVISSSKFHWDGHNWAGIHWIDRQIDLYAKVYDSLRQHSPGFPTPEELKKKVYVGNISNVGAMDKDTPGSNRIVEVLLDDKPGPVYLQAWGGTNTIARALWKIRHEHPDQIERVSRKAVIFIILDQDATYRKSIQPNWPKLQVLGSFRQFAAIAYNWSKKIPQPERSYYERPWMEANILKGHGPLCSIYEANNGAFRSEGDSPAFMHQIRVGLRSMEHPSYGGWGGRFKHEGPNPGAWRGAQDDGNIDKPIYRFSAAFQNDWAARADWCVKGPKQANHPPVAKLAGERDRTVTPGERVTLSAAGSSDPDGDKLYYKWWQYGDADTAEANVKIDDPTSQSGASFVAPNEPGRTVHIILEVTDDGSPPLTRYQRVICTIAK